MNICSGCIQSPPSNDNLSSQNKYIVYNWPTGNRFYPKQKRRVKSSLITLSCEVRWQIKQQSESWIWHIVGIFNCIRCWWACEYNANFHLHAQDDNAYLIYLLLYCHSTIVHQAVALFGCIFNLQLYPSREMNCRRVYGKPSWRFEADRTVSWSSYSYAQRW